MSFVTASRIPIGRGRPRAGGPRTRHVAARKPPLRVALVAAQFFYKESAFHVSNPMPFVTAATGEENAHDERNPPIEVGPH